MERTRVWRGTVRPEAREQHERFVTWLTSEEAAVQYAKYGLTSYTLSQEGADLTISLGADEPTQVIRFLRNQRMWPEFWEFQTATPERHPEQEVVRVRWRRSGAG